MTIRITKIIVMLNKEFLPYEEALALKELGFDEPCLGRWLVITEWEKPTGEVRLQIGSKVENYSKNQCAAPLYQQAFRWFREKYNLHAEPYTADMGAIEYCFQIRDLYSEKYVNDNLKFINGEPIIFVCANGYDTDEPRIGGYPDTIIKSADEMFKAMETGLTNWEGKHCIFRWDKDREEKIRTNIIEFFKAHPDGIIEFG